MRLRKVMENIDIKSLLVITLFYFRKMKLKEIWKPIISIMRP